MTAIETLNQMNTDYQVALAAVKARYDGMPMQQHVNLMRRTGTTNLQDAYAVQARRDVKRTQYERIAG